MKIINYGENYELYSDDLKTFDALPAATYKVVFNPMSGFSLVKIDDFESIEEKIYGNHEEKIEKVLKSYDAFTRSLGIILSGDKGMGKSLFVQLLSKQAIHKGMPVIMVTKAYPGIADFIEKIQQECLVIFDEFEKVFSLRGENGESQDSLLGLFDGTSQRKRLYAITVNKLHQVSEFMVSRTGRFHYHIRFDFPFADEIETYLKDKLEEQYYPQIQNVISFTNRVRLNYDSLRAIAFELNQGYTFGAAISDLNILTTDVQKYDINVNFSNGKTATIANQNLDLFNERVEVDGYTTDTNDWFCANFQTSSMVTRMNEIIVDGKDVNIEFGDQDTPYKKDIALVSVIISQHKDRGVNYKLAY